MSQFSIIIPWANRPELAETLEKNMPEFRQNNAEVIIVNIGGDTMQLKEIIRPFKYPFKTLELPGQLLFNKCICLNMGVYAATNNYLFFLDADIILEKEFLSSAARHLTTACFVTLEKVFESKPTNNKIKSNLSELAYYVEFTDVNNNKALIETSRLFINEKSRSAPGMVLLTKENFIRVNGMNGDLSGWGWEDNDLLSRLQLTLHLEWKRAGTATHLTHGDEVRIFNNSTKKASEAANFSRCLNNYSLGNYAGTYQQDVTRFSNELIAVI
jgi:predicted glycosyltransferase involved in capsule biosynthesis